jgi:hypothetical protein
VESLPSSKQLSSAADRQARAPAGIRFRTAGQIDVVDGLARLFFTSRGTQAPHALQQESQCARPTDADLGGSVTAPGRKPQQARSVAVDEVEEGERL